MNSLSTKFASITAVNALGSFGRVPEELLWDLHCLGKSPCTECVAKNKRQQAARNPASILVQGIFQNVYASEFIPEAFVRVIYVGVQVCIINRSKTESKALKVDRFKSKAI